MISQYLLIVMLRFSCSAIKAARRLFSWLL